MAKKKVGRPKGSYKENKKPATSNIKSKRTNKAGGVGMSKQEREKVISEIVDFILNGYNSFDIVRFINNNYGYNYSHSYLLITEAKKYIAVRTNIDIEHTIKVHRHIYEEVIQYFQNINSTQGMTIGMNRLEKLIGLHKEEENIEINNNTNLEIEQNAMYNIKKLEKHEQNRLKELMDKINDSKAIRN